MLHFTQEFTIYSLFQFGIGLFEAIKKNHIVKKTNKSNLYIYRRMYQV